jgi:hypothetical protein
VKQSHSKPQPEQARPFPFVTEGRIVSYVMKDGQIRPLIVTRVWTQNDINGVLVFDGSNDAPCLPQEHPNPAGIPVLWLTSVHRDDNKAPGTWHWPERV